MTKNKWTACFALLGAAWLALVPGGTAAGTDAVVVEWADNGASVDLPGTRTLELRLPANPSTGYSWQVESLEETRLAPLGDPEFTDSEGVGGNAVEVIRFQPVSAGSTILALAYRRPWESAVDPLSRFTIEVSVTDPIVAAETPVEPMAAIPELAYRADPSLGLPASFDWCALGGCTPVKNQGGCGSCWAFATVGVMESAIKRATGIDQNLSEQYLVSCNDYGYSCNGGWFIHPYHINVKRSAEPEAGAVLESEFPYTARNDPCNSPHTHVARLSSYAYTADENVDTIKQAIYDHGPVAVAVCAGYYFSAQASSVITTSDSCSGYVNHAVILVGWDDARGTSGAWKMRNSWGTGYGSGGYAWIGYGVSNVGDGANYVTGDTSPASPISLAVVDASWRLVNLSWSDMSGNENGFTLERSPDGSTGWTAVATLTKNSTAYTDYSIACESEYYYRLQATNLWGGSSYTETVHATTGECPVWSAWLYLPSLLKH